MVGASAGTSGRPPALSILPVRMLVAALLPLTSCVSDIESYIGKRCELALDCPEPLSCASTAGEGRTCQMLALPEPREKPGGGPPVYFCNEVQPLMVRYCGPCHTGATPSIPPKLDTYAPASAQAERVRIRTAVDRNMPPATSTAQPTDDERELVRRWAEQGALDCADGGQGAMNDAGTPMDAGTRQQGLRGEYFDNRDFTAPKINRVDPTINFDFGAGSPGPEIAAGTFSIRWTGNVQPKSTGPWTFITDSNDGVRLWVNDVMVIDNFTDHGLTTDTGTPINLVADQWYSLKLEYYQAGGTATIRLHWQAAGVAKELLPKENLSP